MLCIIKLAHTQAQRYNIQENIYTLTEEKNRVKTHHLVKEICKDETKTVTVNSKKKRKKEIEIRSFYVDEYSKILQCNAFDHLKYP